jgi:adenine-specific DNA methylase
MQLINEASKEKLRGGFYTPIPIADFLIRWGKEGYADDIDILEPSCGDGVFIQRIKEKKVSFGSLTAIELNPEEAAKTKAIGLPKAKVFNQDFHEYCNTTGDRFDLIIGNPPYIRYQFFEFDQQVQAEKIYCKAALKYSKLSNAWVSFVVGSSLLLKDSGKIAFVLPAELLQVSYAKQLRTFLASFFNSIYIISFKELVFPDIQQEVVLLMCEKAKGTFHHINHIEIKNSFDLSSINFKLLNKNIKDIDLAANKWTYYFLDQNEIDFLNNVAHKYGIQEMRSYSDVEVGMTTGANDFFTVPKGVVDRFDMGVYAKPMVGRSVQVAGAVFSENDWKNNIDAGAKAFLLNFPSNGELKNSNGAKEYIRQGEKDGINKGYKCRIRDYWYVVPSVWASDALFIRRNNVFPKLIVNEANAYTTDTMHRVKIKEGYDLRAVVASYYNSLSFAFAEISGRSYGGGVLELMPNETEDILLPYRKENSDLLEFIDESLRRGVEIDEILKITNAKILKENLGLSDKEIAIAHKIWRKLSNRRLNRSKSK